MAVPAYTTRLGWVADVGPIDQVLYTVQANNRVVVRDVIYTIPTAGNYLNLYVAQPGGSVVSLVYTKGVDEFSHQVELRQAMHVGDQLVVGYQGTDALRLMVTGYVLSEDGSF